MTKEITGWEESFNKEFEVSKGPGRFHEKETFPCEGGYCSTDVSEIKAFISKAIASAVEAREREILNEIDEKIKLYDFPTKVEKNKWIITGLESARGLVLNPSKE